eukprot:CAMPEP_0196663752 /NCGR_PEP_ID=MMETSP1086-20130531/54076_1 /TAXON_ID=77921 /ORGANISM="Cyanoptyche  gloeocystis , Strain SAG4.97" /LENGTH=65 /DNA_ID=CAMNT_0041999693 /DNA_START=369 /DNA_END=566 /DNA_ORIENTATION=+
MKAGENVPPEAVSGGSWSNSRSHRWQHRGSQGRFYGAGAGFVADQDARRAAGRAANTQDAGSDQG